MARARGANSIMAATYEAAYGVPPAGDPEAYFKLPFVSSNLGEEQGLIASDLLGYGREPLDPTEDVANNDGDLVLPVDLRNFGFWLKLAFGQPVSAPSDAASATWTPKGQPANNSTLTLNGTVVTFVNGAPVGSQVQIGANLNATLVNLQAFLAGSADVQLAKCSYVVQANALVVTYKTLGPAGNAFTVAAQAGANGAWGGQTLTGGANSHTFTSGALVLPSMAIEIGNPEVPAYEMNFGARLDKLKVQMQRSGLLNATASLIAQGSTVAAAPASGDPAQLSTLQTTRFAQAMGQIQREGVDLASIVGADFTWANNLDKVETIREDGRIEDSDPGMGAMTGSITSRFSDTTLLDQATARTPCQLTFGWSIGAGQSLLVTVPRVFLPKPKRAVEGPKGIQSTFAWQSALDGTAGNSCSVVLKNDVADY